MVTTELAPFVHAAVLAFSAATEIPASVLPPPENSKYAASVHIDLGRGLTRPLMAVENIDRAERLAAIASTANLRGRKKFVLVTSYLSPHLVEECRKLRLDAIDLSGNVVLHEGKSLIMIAGRARSNNTAGAKPSAWSSKTMQSLLAILTKPDLLKAGYRSIATYAGTSVGTAHTAVQNLVRRRDLIQRADGSYVFNDLPRLIDEWVTLYPSVLRPSLELGRYTSSETDWMPHQTNTEIEWQFGGEAAGAAMTGYLRPATMTIYCEHGIPKGMIAAGRLRPDPAGNIEFLKAPIELRQFKDQAPNIAHPLLVYADLLAIGDSRNIETARILREKYLTV